VSSYGIVTSTYVEKSALAEVARWNDNLKRHTLYTVCDSLQDIWGLYKGQRPVVTGPTPIKLGSTVPYDAAVGAQASPQLFNWVPISYPASYVGLTPQLADTWNPKSMSIAQMVTWGATELKTRIEATPGTFALVGYGVGAMVCSAALQEMQQQSSPLRSRFTDCIGAVMFSNGCREEYVTYPGGTDPGGAGILPQASTGVRGMIRNTSTPSWWWEMAAVDDPVANCPIDTSGQVINVVAEALLNVAGSRDLMAQLAKTIITLKKTGSTWQAIAGKLTNRTANANALTWAERVFALNPSRHNVYSFNTLPSLPTGLPGMKETSTYLDAAVAYINLRGTTISPR
jgi:hypothetical protein